MQGVSPEWVSSETIQGSIHGLCTHDATYEETPDVLDHQEAMHARTQEPVALQELKEKHPPPRVGGGAPRGDGLRLLPHTPRAVGAPAAVPRRDVPLFGDVHQDPGKELHALASD